MQPSQLKLIWLGHCYVQLPKQFVSKEQNLKTGAIISIKSVQNDTELHVMWDGQVTSGDHTQLDLNFAKANNFKDELIVLNSPTNIEPTECSLCRVELVQTSDYNILNQHVDVNVLDKCRLVSEGLIIPIWLSQNVQVLVKVSELQPDKRLGLLTKWTEMQFQHSMEDVPKPLPSTIVDKETTILNPVPIVSLSLGLGYFPKICLGTLLICGERGSGKTYLLKSIVNDYQRFSGEIFNCKQLRGKRPESVKKKLIELLEGALDRQPSILGLDDIDSLVSSDTKHQDEKGQETIYKERLLDIMCYTLKYIERSDHKLGRRVAMIVTSRCLESLDERISKSNGRQFFNEVIRIENPCLEKRVEILRRIIDEHKQIKSEIDDSQLKLIAAKCGSYMPLDLRRLIERGIMAACSRSLMDFNSEPLKLTFGDLTNSHEDYTPSNLRGVALQPKTNRTFENVGGMKEVREELMKTILLQLKYPKLFKKSPIKPQTSILLYGPPGCGKTLIAEALTNQESLNSICIRGPELLSKYIGASEAAVRDLFRRAELAKPCVIFFDEFESLVAKRGADSTGVTDRVVNQFLTLMDGVEKLSSDVFIIAASSRPDMIDPAILRPGRLDKHIYCPVPDQADRLDILKVLSRDIQIENRDSCLLDWSQKLKFFTGADIQSFLYSAQLKALHELVGPSDLFRRNSSDKEKHSELEILVKESHLMQSFEELEHEVQTRYSNNPQQYSRSIRRADVAVSARATLA